MASLTADGDNVDTALRPVVPPPPVVARTIDRTPDPAQDFVARVRAAAPEFAEAAGADSAVVREVVPPARHRVARCRVVLRYSDAEVDLTFLGTTSRGLGPSDEVFDAQIQSWLGSDRTHEEAWLVPDDESPDGLAVDVPAWVAVTQSMAG